MIFAYSGHGVEVSTSVSYAPLTTKTLLSRANLVDCAPTNGINFEEKGVSAIIQTPIKPNEWALGEESPKISLRKFEAIESRLLNF